MLQGFQAVYVIFGGIFPYPFVDPKGEPLTFDCAETAETAEMRQDHFLGLYRKNTTQIYGGRFSYVPINRPGTNKLTLGIFPPDNMLAQLHQEIQEELVGLTLFDDVLPTLDALTHQGIQLAICSNLAKPYGVAIDNLLPEFNFDRRLSYEIGAIKPDRENYESILTGKGLVPGKILFIGDTLLADYEGPTQFGFQAKH